MKTTPKKSNRTRHQSAPTGLSLAFKLIAEPGDTESWLSETSDRLYPLARRVVGGTVEARDKVFHQTVSAMFPNLEEKATEATAVEAGFTLGFATCWLMMKQINGGA